MGYWDSADQMLFESIVRQEQHYKAIYQQANKHYRDNYNQKQRTRYQWRYYFSRASALVWGYGLRPKRALLSLGLSVLLYAFVLYNFDPRAWVAVEVVPSVSDSLSAAIAGMLPFTGVTIGSSSQAILSNTPMIVKVIGALIGLTYFGMFLSILFERIRRG